MLAVHKADGLTIPATVLGLPERFGGIPGGLVSCAQLAQHSLPRPLPGRGGGSHLPG